MLDLARLNRIVEEALHRPFKSGTRGVQCRVDEVLQASFDLAAEQVEIGSDAPFIVERRYHCDVALRTGLLREAFWNSIYVAAMTVIVASIIAVPLRTVICRVWTSLLQPQPLDPPSHVHSRDRWRGRTCNRCADRSSKVRMQSQRMNVYWPNG